MSPHYALVTVCISALAGVGAWVLWGWGTGLWIGVALMVGFYLVDLVLSALESIFGFITPGKSRWELLREWWRD